MSKGTKTTTRPSKFSKPYITQAANAIQSAYTQNQPQLQNISSSLGSLFQNFATQAGQRDPLLESAQGYAQDVLGGKYLTAQNPYLENIVTQTGNSVADRVNALFSSAGRTGSSRQAGELGQQLSEAENALRYQAYGDERSAQERAAALAPQLSAARYQSIAPLLALGQGAAELPYTGAQFLGSNIGNLLGQYTTQKQTPGIGKILQDAAIAAATAASDRRLKTEIRKISEFADGLGLYLWRYVTGGPVQFGVMADEIEKLRPWALGPEVGGFKTVDYARV